MPNFTGSVESLFQPLNLDDFFTNYWENKPLHLARNDSDYFSGLYTEQDIHNYLAFSSFSPNKIRLGIKKNWLPVHWYFDKQTNGYNRASIDRLFKQGVSINVNAVTNEIIWLKRLCHLLSRTFGAKTHANVYFSPGNTYIGPHIDCHDEINLQLSGTKVWRIFSPGYELPYPDIPIPKLFDFFDETGQTPVMELELLPGDLLYVPRGWPHNPVNSADAASLGLTLGLRSWSRQGILNLAIQAAALSHKELRRSLPPDFLSATSRYDLQRMTDELIDQMRKWLPLEEAVNTARMENSDYNPWPENQACPSHDATGSLSHESVFGHPRISEKSLQVKNNGISLCFSKEPIGLRREYLEMASFILKNDRFRPIDLPGSFTHQIKLNFCSFLMKTGVLDFIA